NEQYGQPAWSLVALQPPHQGRADVSEHGAGGEHEQHGRQLVDEKDREGEAGNDPNNSAQFGAHRECFAVKSARRGGWRRAEDGKYATAAAILTQILLSPTGS